MIKILRERSKQTYGEIAKEMNKFNNPINFYFKLFRNFCSLATNIKKKKSVVFDAVDKTKYLFSDFVLRN